MVSLSNQAVHHLHAGRDAFFHADADGVGVLQHRDALIRPDALGQRVLDVLARGVAAGVKDARHAVRALTSQGDLPVHRVERDAPLDQAGDAIGPLPGEHGHGVRITQAGAGLQGIPLVQGRRVARPDRRRDAALRVAAIAVVDAFLGDYQHAAVLGGQQRGVQPGNTAADDDVVVSRWDHAARSPSPRTHSRIPEPGIYSGRVRSLPHLRKRSAPTRAGSRLPRCRVESESLVKIPDRQVVFAQKHA